VSNPYYLRNSDDRWTVAELIQLRLLVTRNTPTRVIALKLGRSERAVRAQASRLELSLKPVNQSPYNRRPLG
jgi:hypothetical protein